MKKSLLATLVLASSPAFAVQFGTDVTWFDSSFDNQVYLPCTGTVIGDGLVLTAEHCVAGTATFNNGDVINVVNRSEPFPITDNDRYVDIALFELESKPSVTAFTPISPVETKAGDKITMYGFGSYEAVSGIPPLGYAVRDVVEFEWDSPSIMYTKDIGQGRSIEGDSGGQTLLNGALVGVTIAGTYGDDIANHSKISSPYVRGWLLDTVNDWHSPTEVKTRSTAVLPIQSLHAQDMGDLLNLVSFSGDASVDLENISCRSLEPKFDSDGLEILAAASNVKPFDVCELTVSSTGYEGFVTLGDYTVTVNKGVHPEPVEPEKPVTPEGKDGSGGGGSLGLLGLFVLGLLSLRRGKK